MQINSVANKQVIRVQQNFKENSVSSAVFAPFSTYKRIPLNISKIYSSSQISTSDYKEISPFDVPYAGEGKLYELKNGHKLAVIPKKGSFVISTFVNAGKKEDPVVSHFLEHLVYDSQRNINGQSFQNVLDAIGAFQKAETDCQYTKYSLSSSFDTDENIEKLIKTQAKLLQAPIDFDKIEKEKNILVSEYSTIAADEDNYREFEKNLVLIVNYLFNTDLKPIGKLDENKVVKSITPSQITDFHNKYYNNNNMFTIIEGDVNFEEITSLFSKHFKKPNIDGPQKEQTIKKHLEPLPKTKRVDIDSNTYTKHNVQVCFIGPNSNDIKNNCVADALGLYILNNNSNYKMECPSLDNYQIDKNILRFAVESEIGREEEKLKDLYKKLFNLTQKSISDEDFELIKLRLKDFYSVKSESSIVLTGIAGADYMKYGDFRSFEKYKYIDTLTKQDVQTFVKQYIDFDKALVMVTHNKPESFNNAKVTSFKGISASEIETKNIQEYRYPNNLQLIVDNSEGVTRTTYMVNLTSNKIPTVKPATAELLQDILKQRLMHTKLNKITNYPFDLKVSKSKFSLSTSVLPEQVKEAVASTNIILKPEKFTQEELDICKLGLKAYYRVFISNKYVNALYKQEYSQNPLGSQLKGLCSYEEIEKYIDDVQLKDINNLYNQIISNSQGKAILVMPKNEFKSQKQELFSLIGAGFGTLHSKQEIDYANKIHIEPIVKPKLILKEEKSDFGFIYQDFQILNSGNVRDYISVKLLSEILGDGTRGRLKTDIRDTKGLAYSAGSYFDTDEVLGYLTLGTDLALSKENPECLKTVLNSFRNNIDKLIITPVGTKELNYAKNILKNDINTMLEFSKGRADILDEYGITDMKNLFYTIDSITPYDVQSIAKKYLTQPSITSIKANKDVLEANREYIFGLGDIVKLSEYENM